ncbi:putative dehydrogenase [Escherichia coli]|nr:putative dehydrogenase [Escherichia coli]
MAIAHLVRSRHTKRWRWGLRKRISTVLLPWRYITRIISAVSVTGQNSAQRRGLSLSTLLAWSVFQWSRRSTVATAALAPIPSVWFFPRKDKFPLLLDYATSAIAFGKTRVAWHKGVPVPPGCLIDVNGVPTTNPAVMQESPLGSLLTFAEHKGYALAAMCEILGGALSGGKTTHQETLQTSPDAILNCMTTIIINPELFGAPDCSAQTEAFAEWVKASPHDDDKPILLPGEWEVNTRRERQEQGIPLDAGSWQAICDAARQIGMPEETLQAFCQQLAS